MFNRFIKEEEGMTMALTVIMVVLIGVMGAGLLTFVQRDLDSVVQVNKGQKAFELADAGAQIARQQIRYDDEPEHYDVDNIASSNYISADCNVTGMDDASGPRVPVASENWSPNNGVSRSFAGGNVEVTIRWMNRSSSADARCKGPVATGVNPKEARYFRVISTGSYNGAKRKVEAIFSTFDSGTPRAYFTPEDLTVNGSACVRNVSLFSLRNINFNGNGECVLAGGGKTHMAGVDLAYGSWKNDYNATARANAGFEVVDAGVGAVGTVDDKVTGRDYDSSTNPAFIRDVPSSGQTSSQITFPFDYKTQSGQPDKERLAFYEELAKSTGNYTEIGGNGNGSISTWPANSTYDTVVYVKFTGSNPGGLQWDVPGNCNTATSKKGILVVENGNFTTQPNRALLSGTVIIRGGVVNPGTYTDQGNTCFEGFANASGEISINGSVDPSSSSDLADSPGFYEVRLWSWRELYK